MSESLEEVRKQIDNIDNQVHDLLMERASLVSSVAMAKKESGMQIVQPAREARMMRRLLARHKGPLPAKTIIRIWRELVGSVSLLQTGLSVAVADDGQNNFSHWDMAKNYFGSAVPMKSIKGYQAAISEVLEGRASFAVLPWPELDQEMPWWLHLFNRQNNDSEQIYVIGALPYEKTGADPSEVLDKALIISKMMGYMPSDDDISFIGLELSSDISRARIKERVENAGFEVFNLYTGNIPHNDEVKVHLLQVKGFVDNGSDSIKKLKEGLGDSCYYCHAIGGYPVIPDIDKKPSEQEDSA